MKLTTLTLFILFSVTVQAQKSTCDSIRMLTIPAPRSYKDVSPQLLDQLKLLANCGLDSTEIEYLTNFPLLNYMAFDFYKKHPDSTLLYGVFLDYYIPYSKSENHQFAIESFLFESKWGNKIVDIRDFREVEMDLKKIGLYEEEIKEIKELILNKSSHNITYKELLF